MQQSNARLAGLPSNKGHLKLKVLMKLLGIFHSYSDPSAALVIDGEVISFVEEERLLRVKHANGYFPTRAINHVLQAGGLRIDDIDRLVQAWDCPAYEDGQMQAIYDEINSQYPTDDGDRAYQKRHLGQLSARSQKGIIQQNLKKYFGDLTFPPIEFVKHHLAHATMAYWQSPFDDALVLTLDGSGEWITTAWWLARGGELELLKEVHIPHSLGWFYSAFTEYLGFLTYDGEYKVMGLAAYGREDPGLRDKVAKIIWYDGQGGFASDPMLISRGQRSHSYYYPDQLIEHMGQSPRGEIEEVEDWHKNLAYEVQNHLQEIVLQMTQYWVEKTQMRNLVMAGGVGLNVKMNGHLYASGAVDDIFVHPLCADAGVSIGAALTYENAQRPLKQKALKSISYGPSFTDDEIEEVLKLCQLPYTKEDRIEEKVAQLLAAGKVIGWFQGGMEAGPRALGNRSILADPRHIESRDRVNEVIKYREMWRPFCPSMTREGAERYLEKFTYAPFMIITFAATQRAKEEIPAVVHVDGTTRPQVVEESANPRYHKLINEFEKITGVPCLLNTSFNIKGEPIVCTPQDAIRTFSATGLEALALGPFLLTKAH